MSESKFVGKTGLILLVVVILLSTVGLAWAAQQYIKSNGDVKERLIVDVDMFWDENLTQPATHIEWGEIEAGDWSVKDMYLLSHSNRNVSLGVVMDKLDPIEAKAYLKLWMEHEGEVLIPEIVVKSRIALYVPLDAPTVDAFTFDVVFIGYE